MENISNDAFNVIIRELYFVNVLTCEHFWRGNLLPATKRGMDTSEELHGYIHDVSPIKISNANNRYFECKLQTHTSEYKRLVYFDSSKKQTFDNAASAKTSTELVNIREVPSMRIQEKNRTSRQL